MEIRLQHGYNSHIRLHRLINKMPRNRNSLPLLEWSASKVTNAQISQDIATALGGPPELSSHTLLLMIPHS